MLLVTERRRLPNWRHHEVLEFHHNGHGFTLGLGNYDDGLIGEIFLTAHKSGSDLEALARDAAIIISVALQHGAQPPRKPTPTHIDRANAIQVEEGV